jgi:spore maturation protein CgeB
MKGEWYDLDDDLDVLITLLDAYDLKQICPRKKRLYTIAWARNWFDNWVKMPCFNDYDFVYASSYKACEYIVSNSRQKAELLPIASNPSRFQKSKTCDSDLTKSNDIVFTGSYWNTPRDIMEYLGSTILKKYKFSLYGSNWDEFKKFSPYYKGFIDYEELPCIYQHTKIVLDDANHVTKPYGSVNSRVFDAILAGALVITNGKQGSLEMFEGKLPYYTSSKELNQLLDYYLNNDKARKSKINELSSMILSRHTYKHRAESIRSMLINRFTSKSIAIKIPAPTWDGVHSWGDFHMAVSLKQELEKLGYYVLLQVLCEWDNDAGMECDAVIVFRGLSRYTIKSHQINIMWNISHPDMVSLDEYEEYDMVFIASQLWAKKINSQVSVPVEEMLQCTDPDRFIPPKHLNEVDSSVKSQLLFVGNSRNVFRRIIKDLLPTNYHLSVYGNNWEKLLPLKYIKGDYIENKDLYKYYGSADILLNDHWDDMRMKGFVSNRIFDGLASAAFIITDNVAGMGELKKYVQTYETKEELHEFIDYFLNHNDERKKIASEGASFVRKNHTFNKRAKVFSNAITSLYKLKQSKS